MGARPNWIDVWGKRAGPVGMALAGALFMAVNLLPQDASLSRILDDGRLRACVPPPRPPLVTGVPAEPGFDVALLEAIAGRLGVVLSLEVSPSMSGDFNPRNWHLTRARCQIIAGGLIASQRTRSFLDTTPSYLETGWMVVSTEPLASLSGLTVGFLGNQTNLDRAALAEYLKTAGATVRILRNPEALAAGIADGSLNAGVTEALSAGYLAGAGNWHAAWLPVQPGRSPVAFGLWKGDVTLRRELATILDDLARGGFIAQLKERYGVVSSESRIALLPQQEE